MNETTNVNTRTHILRALALLGAARNELRQARARRAVGAVTRAIRKADETYMRRAMIELRARENEKAGAQLVLTPALSPLPAGSRQGHPARTRSHGVARGRKVSA